MGVDRLSAGPGSLRRAFMARDVQRIGFRPAVAVLRVLRPWQTEGPALSRRWTSAPGPFERRNLLKTRESKQDGHVGRGLQPMRRRLALLCALVAGGCSTASVDPKDAIGIQWVVPDETTPCPEIRGHLALTSLLDVRRRIPRAARAGYDERRARVEADFAGRCPPEGDVALDIHAVSFPDHHCAYLRGMLTTIAAFDMTGTLTGDERAVADLLAAEVETEIERRCD